MSCVYCYVTVAYVCIPRSFLVINVCNQGKTLYSPCIYSYMYVYIYASFFAVFPVMKTWDVFLRIFNRILEKCL
jgi:hypothetical protein